MRVILRADRESITAGNGSLVRNTSIFADRSTYHIAFSIVLHLSVVLRYAADRGIGSVRGSRFFSKNAETILLPFKSRKSFHQVFNGCESIPRHS